MEVKMRGLIVLLILQISGFLCNNEEKSVNSDAVISISRSFNEFAKDLYKIIAKHEEGNFVFSPISVSILLSMLAIGSSGDTRNQLKDVLHFDDNWILQHTAIRQILEELDRHSKDDLKLANHVFLSDEFNLNDNFVYYANLYFRISSEYIDLGEPREASKLVNEWCHEQTDSKIQNLVASGDFTSDTIMMLLSAAYLKANWAEAFDKSETKDLPFKLRDGTIKQVATMHHRGNYGVGYLPDLNAKFLRIPYENAEKDNLSMYIILPVNSTDFSNLEANLSRLDLNILSNVPLAEIDVFLPKFRVDSKLELIPSLKELGLTDIFTPEADFRHLVTSRDVAVSKFSQKTFMEVDENGSEAAALTETDSMRKMDTPRFLVNGPFISLVATKNSILFMSRIIEPLNM